MTETSLGAARGGVWSGSEPIENGWLDRHPSNTFLMCVLVVSSVAVGVGLAIRLIIGISIVIAVAATLVILRKPAVGGYLLVGLVPITSGFLPGVPVPRLRLSELLIVGIAAIVLLSASARQSLPWTVLDISVLVYVVAAFGIGTIDVIRDHDHKSFELFGTLAGPLQFFLLYRTVSVSLPRIEQRKFALRVLFLASIPVSLLALLQQLRLHGVNAFIAKLTGSSIFQSYSYHAFARATGPFDHWTPLAGYLLVILILGISLNMLAVGGIMSKRAMFVIIGLDTIGMLLSAELSAMAALVLGGLALGVWSGRIRLLARWAVPIVIVAAVLFGSYFVQRLHTEFGTTLGSSRKAFVPQTIAYRWQVWTQQYFPAIRSRLMHGYGPVLPSSITWPDTESQYVTYLMWGGVPLLMIFVAMMWALYHRARLLVRPIAKDPSLAAIARALVVLIIAIYPIDTIFPYFTSSGLPQAFWVLVGIMLAAQRDILAPRPSGMPLAASVDYDSLAERFTPV